MPVANDTSAARRHLPHLEKPGKTYFSTFVTHKRQVLPHSARDIALRCCVHDHRISYWLNCAVVMPDHVHMIFEPYERLSYIMDRFKGASAHLINKAIARKGHVWRDESFDRIVRAHEDLWKKCEYVCNNPVRAGLVESPNEWPWLWREWIEGARDSRGRLSST